MKRILTGIKPTGDIHIGNYFGAIAPILAAQAAGDREIYLFLAHMHALTALHDPVAISENCKKIIKIYIACGIDPQKCIIYSPTVIPAHAEASRILGCITNMGTMERMHGYKDAINKGIANEISVGTFTYPILMAADILLYGTHEVPVGKDQKQHVEYARDIADKFNRMFGETFVLPEPLIDESVATVPGIDGRKMSKSYNNVIALFDDAPTVLKKIKLIPTGSESLEDPKNPDTCNVFAMLKLFLTPDEEATRRATYTAGGMGYKVVKDALHEKLMAFLTPIQERYHALTDADVYAALERGTAIAGPQAAAKVQEMKEKVGFIL